MYGGQSIAAVNSDHQNFPSALFMMSLHIYIEPRANVRFIVIIRLYILCINYLYICNNIFFILKPRLWRIYFNLFSYVHLHVDL